jgi:hypothetical protein
MRALFLVLTRAIWIMIKRVFCIITQKKKKKKKDIFGNVRFMGELSKKKKSIFWEMSVEWETLVQKIASLG